MGRHFSAYLQIKQLPLDTVSPICHCKGPLRRAQYQGDKVTDCEEVSDKEYEEENGCTFLEAEYAVLKTSHAEIGAYLLGLWGLPDYIVETVAFHHNPSKIIRPHI